MKAAAAAAIDKLVEMVAETNEVADGGVLREGHPPPRRPREGPPRRGPRRPALPGVPRLLAAQRRRAAPARRRRGPPALARRPRAGARATIPSTKAEATREPSASDPFSAFVFKTIADPHAGRISLFRVYSGTLKADSHRPQRRAATPTSAWAPSSCSRASSPVPVPEIQAGDLGAVAKLKDTHTGDTLSDKAHPIVYPAARPSRSRPPPSPSSPRPAATRTRSRVALHRLMEEDPVHPPRPTTPRPTRCSSREWASSTSRSSWARLQEALQGRGQPQEAEDPLPRDHQGRGRGPRAPQEADGRPRPVRRLQDPHEAPAPRLRLQVRRRHLRRLDPQELHPRGGEGHPGRAAARASWPATPWSTSRSSSTTASTTTWTPRRWPSRSRAPSPTRTRWRSAGPTLLEPIMKVEIAVPEEYAGAVMGDLSSRRGRPQGMEPKGSLQVVRAEVPLSEMLSYDAELTSMTGGRGSYHMEMAHYDEVPGHLQDKVVAAARAERARSRKRSTDAADLPKAHGVEEGIESGPGTGSTMKQPLVASLCRSSVSLALSPLVQAQDRWWSRARTASPRPSRRRPSIPSYPPEAQAQGVRGIVILELLIDPQGKVASAEVIRSIPPSRRGRARGGAAVGVRGDEGRRQAGERQADRAHHLRPEDPRGRLRARKASPSFAPGRVHRRLPAGRDGRPPRSPPRSPSARRARWRSCGRRRRARPPTPSRCSGRCAPGGSRPTRREAT